MAGARSLYGIKRYSDETKRLYSVLESRLPKADWLAGDKYTIADIACYSWVRESPIILKFDLNGWPGVARWLEMHNCKTSSTAGSGCSVCKTHSG